MELGFLARLSGRIGLAAAMAGFFLPLSTAAYAVRPVPTATVPHRTVPVPPGLASSLADVPSAVEALAVTGTPKTYRVYATREGLVGRTTANGHVIVANDHFVSLPSTLSLSAIGKNSYSVRVCSTTNGRCAYEPVWDVGPWNTHDDYWSIQRTSWTMLPIGRPEAQAAYQQKYNGGKDQFGRTVTNPAGIDLADGTIHAGLDLSDGGWVNVTYLWTGGGLRGTITTKGGTVNVRSGDSTAHANVGLAGPHALIPILCQVKGQPIVGTHTSVYWYEMATGNWISAAYVGIPAGSKIKTC